MEVDLHFVVKHQILSGRKEPSVFTVKIIVNICANIYDISRIALKTSLIFAVYCAMHIILYFGV